MNTEDIKRLADNPHFIPGIYNYCDRWCERCAFTSRCLNYALSEKHFADPEARDPRNAAFWRQMNDILRVTLDLLRELAAERGIDLDAIDIATQAAELERRREIAEAHECVRMARAYADMVDGWFDAAEPLFVEKEEELKLQVRLNIPGADPTAKAATIRDAVEVIRWYQHQIYVKLMRAVQGTLDEWSELLEGFPRDSDGSAKVALIAMDRSIAAWGILHRHFPEEEDRILQLLVHLDRLRRETERHFPAARSFVRPGFDEIDP